MRILNQGELLPEDVKTVITVGNFDGVHRGHTLLMAEMVRRAAESGVQSAVVTFEPHTRAILTPDLPTERLTTFEEKAHLIERCGIDYTCCIPFTREFSRQSPEGFVESVLCDVLHASGWIMGEGHGVGRNRSGGKNLLRTILSKYHIKQFTADLLKCDTTIISSTQIRAHIVKGRVADAVEMLGHPYLISAERVQGVKVGTQLGFPTCNFSRPPSQKVLPPPGVYAAELEYRGSMQPGALYFGDCPTFTGRPTHFEFHAFGHEEGFPAVGETGRLWLHDFIRPDRTFPNPEQLVVQIEKDISTIKLFFKRS